MELDRLADHQEDQEEFRRQFRQVLGHYATGVAIVTAVQDHEPVGMTVQSLCSLSLDPPLVLVCPARSSTTWPRIRDAGRFCINLLTEDQDHLARQFARSGTDKYAGVTWVPSAASGSPLLEEALGWIDCDLDQEYPGGDHLVAICRVNALGAQDLAPLVFFQSEYRRIVQPLVVSMADMIPWPM